MKQKILLLYYKLLARCAKRYIDRYDIFVIGINGSVGKTSCRSIVTETLQKFLPEKVIYTSSKNFNGEFGMSLSIFQIESFYPSILQFLHTFFYVLDMTFLSRKKPYDIIVLEYGIDRPNEMSFLLDIVKPDIGIFTALDSVHSEQFGNPQAIAQEEIKMIQNTKEIAFLNYDDPYSLALSKKINIEKFTYHTLGYETKADIFFQNEILIYDKKIYATFDLNIKKQKISVKTNLIGKSHYGYIGVALTISEILYYKYYNTSKLKDIDAITLNYKLQSGRFNIFDAINKNIIIDSSYNASPGSIRYIIDISHTIKKQLYPDHKIILFIGDMRELGDLSEQEHRQIVSYLQAIGDIIFLVGDMTQRYSYDELKKIGFDMKCVHSYLSSRKAGKHIKEIISEQGSKYIIVCKGSQNTVFIEEGIKEILLNPEDEKHLSRQSDRRLRKKDNFFKTLVSDE